MIIKFNLFINFIMNIIQLNGNTNMKFIFKGFSLKFNKIV